MDFEDWVKEARDKSQEVNSKRSLGEGNFGSGQEKAFDVYIGYIKWRENKKLVKTTWWLMFATWILAIANIILIFFAK
ncbi:MAG: hypothetical protein ABIJ14_02350 [Nanoarchaeota archaeon]